MAKRYGQRPSTLLPRETFKTEEQALAFDMNVMLLGMTAEIKAQQEAMNKSGGKGLTQTRGGALALGRKARQMADEIWGK